MASPGKSHSTGWHYSIDPVAPDVLARYVGCVRAECALLERLHPPSLTGMLYQVNNHESFPLLSGLRCILLSFSFPEIMRLFQILAMLFLATSPSLGYQQQKPASSKHEVSSPAPCPPSEPTVIGQQQVDSTEKEPSAKNETQYWQEWTRPPVLLTLALVVAAFWAGCLALRTLKILSVQARANLRAASAAKRNADVLGKQVAIQEAALRQWVNTDSWHVEVDEFGTLIFAFEAINRTPVPLWLDAAIIAIGGGQEGNKVVATWLIPNSPFIVKLGIKGTKQQVSDFEIAKLILPLYVSIFFRDALNKHWRQEIQLILIPRPGGAIVNEYRTQVFDSARPPE